jgi:P4 family phage/plasmid primase-like protien
MKVFAKKSTALKYSNNTKLVCNDNIKKYFLLDDYSQFATLIQNTPSPSFYEYIKGNTPVNLFFDIEIYKDSHPTEFDNSTELIQEIKDVVRDYFNCQAQFIVLESHNDTKKSYHIIVRLFGDNCHCPMYFENVKLIKPFVKSLFEEYTKQKIIDTSVYREGLFRTYLSTKDNESRPLVKSSTLSDDFTFEETFVGFTLEHFEIIPNNNNIKINSIENNNNNSTEIDTIEPTQLTLSDQDISVIKKFVRKSYKYRNEHLRDVFIDRNLNCIIVALDDKFCHNIDREHKSNHQYIVIDTISSKQKCHDLDCKDYKHDEFKFDKFPTEINEIILKCLKVNKQEQELIEKAIDECKKYITSNFDQDIETIEFDRQEMVFRGNATENNTIVRLNGKCESCLVEHRITTDGYCLKCKICHTIFPRNSLIPLEDKYKHLNTFWNNYNQLVNNGTVIINNYYNGEEEFQCDIQLDNSIFKNRELTKVYNQILDGHKVVLISELMSKVEVDFKYTNGEWYFFDGIIWKQDRESLEFRKRIVKLSSNFKRIQQHYETKVGGDNSAIIKNVKSLINKLHKTGFEDEIIKGGKMYYNDESFIKNLNSKKHLVPFSNGVYDLLENTFRPTGKEDYVNLTCGYNFDNTANNPEVHDFINKVLPSKGVRDYVLKKMSECLNGDIPNTNFLMFIGDGANGKSQLLNLMKLCMGELGEKVEVTLLTRKRNNANEANSEKIKLMNKRFAFLSEPEDGEKINIGLLKELTGSEEVVARGLYQESVSFVMEAKLFLACNELPEIKGEDTALWRRIRVIDFPSRFVDQPKESNEYKIDRTLPSRMREDISWRQTFMNILLDYYSVDVEEPVEVQLKTNEYREENNEFFSWLQDNINYKDGAILKLQDTLELFSGRKISSRHLGKYRKEMEKFIKEKFPNIDHEYKQFWIHDIKYKGWLHLEINN